jgi:hypothetical protein
MTSDGEEKHAEMDGVPVFADAPDCLYTSGVGPCIAVAYLNKSCGRAGLIHEPRVADCDTLEKFLDEAKRRTEPCDNVEIQIFGGDSSDDAQSAEANREATRSLVRDAFPNVEPITNWINDGSYYRVGVFTDPPKVNGTLVALPSSDEDDL